MDCQLKDAALTKDARGFPVQAPVTVNCADESCLRSPLTYVPKMLRPPLGSICCVVVCTHALKISVGDPLLLSYLPTPCGKTVVPCMKSSRGGAIDNNIYFDLDAANDDKPIRFSFWFEMLSGEPPLKDKESPMSFGTSGPQAVPETRAVHASPRLPDGNLSSRNQAACKTMEAVFNLTAAAKQYSQNPDARTSDQLAMFAELFVARIESVERSLRRAKKGGRA